ncbi:hypothetical protein BASA81_001794 [Batrachochytrium salamandrivorans]|nr:hypothetical protein BASA81_001794 [Batrachochytrium salamandrivorans]
MKVTVEPNRKSVFIVNFGSLPFAADEEGKLVPNGFQVRTKANKRWWIATVRVSAATLMAEYQFVCENDRERGTGEWMDSPTGAFQNVNGPAKLNDAKYHKGTNGALLIGVKYASIQLAIREHFTLPQSPSPIPPSPTYKRAKMEPEHVEPIEVQADAVRDDLLWEQDKLLVLFGEEGGGEDDEWAL